MSDFLNGLSDAFNEGGFFNAFFRAPELLWSGATGQLSNEKINAENLAFQQENLDYQKALQQEIFEREDTSYQRTAQDMRAAGLSPMMMKGTNGSGSVVPTQAPQKQFESVNAIPLITQALTELNSLSVGQAQRDNINAQTRAQELENDFNEWNLNYRKNQSFYNDFTTKLNARKFYRDYNIDLFTGQSGNEFMNSVNQARIASGKKPLNYDVMFKGVSGHKEYDWIPDNRVDFNSLVDYSRYALTVDMIDKIGNLIPKTKFNIGGRKK